MKVVIDTNCLLSCIGKKSPYRNVFDLFLSKKMTFCASTEILLEYEESFNRFWGKDVTQNLMGLFETRDNFEHVIVYYNWQLIRNDEDDNKFIDAYVAAKADYLISNDSSITGIKNNSFPPLAIMTLQEFSNMLSPQ
ncbi:MAG: putative toxin-antitoxin system toxin component, PIN family [Sphingobacteriales bacterium]|nr:putative toxin-antitoxin system toxin component, PIN family [Sphingobacteriales bacterium]